MRIYSIFVLDEEFGDMLIESYTHDETAKTQAWKLRKTFRKVVVRPSVLHVGYKAPDELKRLNGRVPV